MTKLLIVVAHRSGARYFETNGPNKEFSLVQEDSHEDGRLKNKDLSTDRQGSSGESGASERHGFSRKTAEKETVSLKFAKHIADSIDKMRSTGRYGKFLVCADPHFLGLIRESIPKKTEQHVEKFVTKDYSNAGRVSIEEGLADAVKEIYHKEMFAS